MRITIAVLALATCCFSAEVQNKGLDDVSARIMERLSQEHGSERGVYHVYLQDGRLQRVQYTTAPVSSQQPQQQQANNYNQQEQTPDILSPESAGRRGVYFVQVPQERVQALQANSRQNPQVLSSAQTNQEQANQVNVRYLPLQTAEAAPRYNAQLNQEQANQVNVRYLPLQTPEAAPRFNAQPNQEQANQVNVRYLPLQTPEAAPRFNAQLNQEQGNQVNVRYLPLQTPEAAPRFNAQQQEPSGYVANVQYSQVEPIQGPVYSYGPQQLTRILRYAPAY